MKRRDPARRLGSLGTRAQAELSALLSASEETRAEAIGRLHSRDETRQLAEILIDVEGDPVLRLEVLRALRESLRGLESM